MLTAVAAWPFPAGDRAPAALRAHLRQSLLDRRGAGADPADGVETLDWSTLTVTGPTTELDRGRTWFTYTATVLSVPARPR